MLSPSDILKKSLTILVDSFHATECRGYYQGREAYEAWIKGLTKEIDFQLETDRENVLRRLCVNDAMLCSLIDARRAAASYLHENISLLTGKEREHLKKIAENFLSISDSFSAFRAKLRRSSTCKISYNMINAFGISMPKYRREQIKLLENALVLEEENCRLAESILSKKL